MDLRIVEICTEIWSEVSARKIVMASRKWGLESDRVEIDARVFKHWRLQSVLRAARFFKKIPKRNGKESQYFNVFVFSLHKRAADFGNFLSCF